MAFVIEIVLTVVAWRRGWRWLALLPVAVVFFLGFFAGVMIGMFGGNVQMIMPFGLLLDLLCIVILVVLVAVPLKEKEPVPAMVAEPLEYEQPTPEPEVIPQEEARPVRTVRAISAYGGEDIG